MFELSQYKDGVRSSFYITYAFLITTGTITFIEALRTNDSKIRHILNLETVISIIAGYFYSQFIKKIQSKELDYREINSNRYLDWAITTPVMLLVLCLVFCYNNKTQLTAKFFLVILLLNYVMLGLGYLGENKTINKDVGLIGGWIAFVVLYGLLYMTYLHGRNNFDNKMIFWAFVIFWSGYGLLYKSNEKNKNIGYNVLDLFSKCFVGIFFWAYLTKVLVIF